MHFLLQSVLTVRPFVRILQLEQSLMQSVEMQPVQRMEELFQLVLQVLTLLVFTPLTEAQPDSVLLLTPSLQPVVVLQLL